MDQRSHSRALKRVLSGMRPTGKLHLGNYMGALYNWVRLQRDFNCYFFIADWHALTTDYADTSNVQAKHHRGGPGLAGRGTGPGALRPLCAVAGAAARGIASAALHDYASGLAGARAHLQGAAAADWRCRGGRQGSAAPMAFSGILCCNRRTFCIYQADLLPVGQDQVAHVEITREIARRFNQFYPPAIAARRRCLAGTAGAADSFAQAAGNRWAEDVQELRQHHPAHRSRTGGAAEAEDDGDRSGAGAAQRSGRSRTFARWAICTRSSPLAETSKRCMPAAARPGSAVSSARAG